MSDNLKIKARHICGIHSCGEKQDVLISSYENKIYVENLSDHKIVFEASEEDITDFEYFEEEELKENFSVLKILTGYALLDIAGAVLGGLSGIKVIPHQYLYIKTKSEELLFECA